MAVWPQNVGFGLASGLGRATEVWFKLAPVLLSIKAVVSKGTIMGICVQDQRSDVRRFCVCMSLRLPS